MAGGRDVEDAQATAAIRELVYENVTLLNLKSPCMVGLCPCLEYFRSDSVAFEFAEAVDMDLDRHILRHENYKGRKRQLSEQCLHLPFDGWTLPALYVVAACHDNTRTRPAQVTACSVRPFLLYKFGHVASVPRRLFLK